MSLYTKAELKIINGYLKRGVELNGLFDETIPTEAYELYTRYKKIYYGGK